MQSAGVPSTAVPKGRLFFSTFWVLMGSVRVIA